MYYSLESEFLLNNRMQKQQRRERTVSFILSRSDVLVSVERQHVARLSLSAAPAVIHPSCWIPASLVGLH